MASPVVTCIAWGSLDEAGHHQGCPVVFESEVDRKSYPQSQAPASYPVVCPCECRDCQRAWWGQGRPIVRDGRVVRRRS
jgi:hypothetical protein